MSKNDQTYKNKRVSSLIKVVSFLFYILSAIIFISFCNDEEGHSLYLLGINSYLLGTYLSLNKLIRENYFKSFLHNKVPHLAIGCIELRIFILLLLIIVFVAYYFAPDVSLFDLSRFLYIKNFYYHYKNVFDIFFDTLIVTIICLILQSIYIKIKRNNSSEINISKNLSKKVKSRIIEQTNCIHQKTHEEFVDKKMRTARTEYLIMSATIAISFVVFAVRSFNGNLNNTFTQYSFIIIFGIMVITYLSGAYLRNYKYINDRHLTFILHIIFITRMSIFYFFSITLYTILFIYKDNFLMFLNGNGKDASPNIDNILSIVFSVVLSFIVPAIVYFVRKNLSWFDKPNQ